MKKFRAFQVADGDAGVNDRLTDLTLDDLSEGDVVIVWKPIAGDLRPRHLDAIIGSTIDFADLPGAFSNFIDGKVTGRTSEKIG